jgi:basic membrane protein A
MSRPDEVGRDGVFDRRIGELFCVMEQARLKGIEQDADVIFGIGGPTGSGAIAAAAKDGIFDIGSNPDEYMMTSRSGTVEGVDKILTSAFKRFDNAAFQVVQDVVNGTFTSEAYRGTVANGGVDYAEAHDTVAVTSEIKAKVDGVKQSLSDGSITTGIK